MDNRLWAVILAGGAGTRLAGVTRGVPKQFWRADGEFTLLEATLARIAPLVPSARCVIVTDEAHREFLSRCDIGGAHVVAQPVNRGTAAAVLYGLVSVLTKDPQAVVLITPADHGVINPSIFVSAIRDGVDHVASSGQVMLFGAPPSTAHTDHGWIAMTRGAAAKPIQRVATFVEKPGLETAFALWRSGALLNTMIAAGTARALLELCRARLPDSSACFVGALTLPGEVRDAVVRARYPRLATCDFSRDVITGAADLLVYRLPAAAGWSDLGTPDRLASWLAARSARRRAGRESVAAPARATAGVPGHASTWRSA